MDGQDYDRVKYCKISMVTSTFGPPGGKVPRYRPSPCGPPAAFSLFGLSVCNVHPPNDAYTVTMTRKLLFVLTILLVASFALMAADASGKWTFEQPGRGGGPGRPVTITLKVDGTTLTGSIPGMGRGGDTPPPPTEITDGKVDGNNVSFTVKRETPNGVMETKYAGTLSGDEMKLKITRNGQDGTPVTTEVTAKRTN